MNESDEVVVLKPEEVKKSKEDAENEDSSFLAEFNSHSSNKKGGKSAFHNFQKHLVTTIRHSIKIAKLPDNPETRGIEKQLWSFFMKTNRMTRTLLYLVYGGLDLEVPKNKRILKQYGLANLYRTEPHCRILEAQKILREETLKQAEEINLDWELGNRRMKNKDDFRIYFKAFLD